MPSASSSHPIDRFIPWFFVAFFVGLALLLGWFVHLAISTDSGVVNSNAYKEGLAYNAIIEKQVRQDKLGWRPALEISALKEKQAAIRLTLQDKNGAPLRGATIQFMLIRPTQAGLDTSIILPETTPGRYESSVAVPLPGVWKARITVQAGNDSYQMEKRVVLAE